MTNLTPSFIPIPNATHKLNQKFYQPTLIDPLPQYGHNCGTDLLSPTMILDASSEADTPVSWAKIIPGPALKIDTQDFNLMGTKTLVVKATGVTSGTIIATPAATSLLTFDLTFVCTVTAITPNPIGTIPYALGAALSETILGFTTQPADC